jgi:hypothetical protein
MWSVNDVVGGDAVVGTITSGGLYQAPVAVAAPTAVTVRARSLSTIASGTAAVTVLPLPSIASVTPAQVSTGAFTLTITGTGFVPGSVVSFDGQLLSTSYVTSTQLTAQGSAAAAQVSVPVGVSTPDGERSNLFSVTVVSAPAIAVSVSPATATVRVRQTLTLSATVTGTSTTAVVWTVNGLVGGNATVGTVSAAGVYKAPSQVPSPSSVTVSATASADPTKSASATVTIVRR